VATLTPDIRIFVDLNALSQAAAGLFAETAAGAIRQRGQCLVALSGGGTPARLYELLATSPFAEQVQWQHVHAFWGDERGVPPDDPESNYHQAYQALLSRVPIPPENIQRVHGESQPAEAAVDYARTLQAFANPPLSYPRFDLVLLGMGEDGHTASLFPGSQVDLPGPTAAVTAHYEGRPANRVTLTPLVLNAARSAVFLVSGESKSATVADVLKGSYRPELLPAQRIHPADGALIWMLDRAAASKL
jgi:6-phosphogluconolactonase